MTKQINKLALERVAYLTVGASTLRRQGAAGVIEGVRKYVARYGLAGLGDVTSLTEYQDFLDSRTSGLYKSWQRNLKPSKGNKTGEIGSWGAARKSINLFILAAHMNRYVGLPRKIRTDWLEVPIDKIVADKLRENFRKAKNSERYLRVNGAAKLRSWPGLGRLSEKHHQAYQHFASWLGSEWGIARVFLDLEFWGKVSK